MVFTVFVFVVLVCVFAVVISPWLDVVLGPAALLTVVRSYSVGVIEIADDHLRAHGLFRTLEITRAQFLGAGGWSLRYRNPRGRKRRWYLTPYVTNGGQLPSVTKRSDDVMETLRRLGDRQR